MQAINTQEPNFDKLNLRNNDMEQDQSDKTSSSSHMQQDEESKDIETEIEEVMGAQEYDEEIKEEEEKDIEVAISEVMGEEETKEEIKEPESPQILPCQKRHARCGHMCDGVAGEHVCPPCLEDECSIHAGAAHQLHHHPPGCLQPHWSQPRHTRGNSHHTHRLDYEKQKDEGNIHQTI